MLPIRDDVPSRSRPWVLYCLLVANTLMFLFELSLGGPGLQRFVSAFGVKPAEFAGQGGGGVAVTPPAAYLSIFVAMFLHGSWLHLIVNMWYLWIFGDNVEDRMGHGAFLIFYLMGGVVASVAHILLNWGSDVPSIGASGAIAAVLGAYLVLFPGARILTIVPFFFLFIARLPAILVLGAWFVLQLWSGVGSIGADAAGSGGVAYWAHIGGFLFGLVAVHVFAPRGDTPSAPPPQPQERWWATE